MRFSPEEIQRAGQLKELGLPWTPFPGHYVWDETGLIEQHSPFHDRVYFILDLKHFLRRAGSLDQLKAAVRWLPTWHDARQVLADWGVSNEEITQALAANNALLEERERAVLYELLETTLKNRSQGALQT